MKTRVAALKAKDILTPRLLRSPAVAVSPPFTRETSMPDIRVPDDLWSTSLMPEAILERWLVSDGASVSQGQPIAMIRVGENLHEISAPAGGLLRTTAAASSMVEPGSLIAELSA